MSFVKQLFNGKNAFQAADLDDLYFPISDEQREILQKIIYEMYQDVLAISAEYSLTPFLVGGSALGAIRHEGFIPWDDDLDIGFVRSEYEIFLDAFEKRYEDKYYVNSPGRQNKTRARFTKILKKGTVFRDMISLQDDELNGVFVDVFPIDNVPDNNISRKLKGFMSDSLAYISSQVFNRENRTEELIAAFKRTGKANYYIRMGIGLVFSFHDSSWWFAKYDSIVQCPNEHSLYCTIAAGRKHYFGEMIRREKIFPARMVPFGPVLAPVFNDVESYLSHMYGDYMTIPPIEKRERHYVKELRV